MRSKTELGSAVLRVLRDGYDDYVRQNILAIIEKCKRVEIKKKPAKVWGKKRCPQCKRWIKWKAKICRRCYLRTERKKGVVKGIKNHGSSRGYQTGCRCLECKAWKREYNSKRVWK